MNTTETPIDLVSAALVECQGKLKTAHFDATNPFFKSKYATLGAVIEASREALHASGLAILQKPVIQGDNVTVQTSIVHKSGQFLDCGCLSLTLDANDRNSDAQIAGGILTYLRRYAWSTVLGIYADDDDDGNRGPKGAIARQTTITTPQANKNAPQTTPSVPTGHPATEKHRLKALNNLQAAPGQANVGLVEGYLRSKGWLVGVHGHQGVMDWPLEHVPTTAEQMSHLSEDVMRFETDMREGRGVA